MRACPFCQLSSRHTEAKQFCTAADGFFFVVVCGACKARGPQRQSYNEAVNAWNHHVAPTSLDDIFGTIFEG